MTIGTSGGVGNTRDAAGSRGIAARRGMRFAESMVGTWRRPRGSPQPFRFDIEVATPRLLRPFGTVTGVLSGTVDATGLASGARVSGSIEISPVSDRRIRYGFDFTGDDGSAYRFEGWKSIEWLHAARTWTTLPGTIYDASGAVVGTADTRFATRTIGRFLSSMRVVPKPDDRPGALEARRWDGAAGRLEVWYDTFRDPRSGTGFWLHHELCAPSGGGPPEARGWIAVFPPDGEPSYSRFGPAAPGAGPWFECGDVVASPGRRSGSTDAASWDLTYSLDSSPLFTFPASVWQREVLPGAQIVPSPTERFSGTVRSGERLWSLSDAPGGAARIYGHGNAERWGWLHADLGGGDVLEIVAAVSRKPGLNRLPPLTVVALRLDGVDWPANPLLAAPRFRASLGVPRWTVTGGFGDRRLRVTVDQAPGASVVVPYSDPDGSSATCTNSERADAHVVLERRASGAWSVEREWRLEGTAHSEIGTRP